MKINLTNIHNFKVRDTDDLNEVLAFFTGDEQRLRLDIYQQYSVENNIAVNEAKDEILHNMLGEWIKNSLQNALKQAENGNPEEAVKIVNLLISLKPIFKPYDISTHSSFIESNEPNISSTELSYLLEEPSLNKYELSNVVNALIESISSTNNPVISSKDSFIEGLVNSKLLLCLESHSNSSVSLQNIENETIELGHYKKLVEIVLKLKTNLHKEAYQGLIFFLINEDLDNQGLYNICKNEDYEPRFIRNLLQKIINGEELTNYDIQSASENIKNSVAINYSLNQKNGELERNKNSMFALNDSGFISKKAKTFLHIHTAQSSGNGQNHQHGTTATTLMNKGVDPIGITILEQSAYKTDNVNDYLYPLRNKFDFTERETIFLSELQFTQQTLQLVYSLQRKNKIDINESKILASNFTFIENQMVESIEFNKQKTNKTDIDNILNYKTLLVSLLSNNSDFFSHCLNHTSTDNTKLYQHISSPLLNTIETLMGLEKVIRKKIFSNNDIEIISKVLELHDEDKIYNNNTLESTRNRINEAVLLSKELGLPFLIHKTELLDFCSKRQIKKEATSHKEALEDYSCDFIKYFSQHKLDNKNVPEEEMKEMRQILRHRINHELKNSSIIMAHSAIKESVINSVNALLDKFERGENIYFAKGDYNKSSDDGARTIARLVMDETQNKKSIKSEMANINDSTLLNMIALSGKMYDKKILCRSYYDIVENPLLKSKISVF